MTSGALMPKRYNSKVKISLTRRASFKREDAKAGVAAFMMEEAP